MSATLGQSEMESRMQKHWSSWITEGDFGEMASYGINFVRIPIGYWSVSPVKGDPYVQGAYEWLGKAIDWAGSNGINVMIDLHGAPGSQNGFDNSGRKGPIDWTQGRTVAQTLRALKKIRNDHASNPAVAAIELLNEPMGSVLDIDTIKQFYYNGWGDMKNAGVCVTIHDAFQGPGYWNDWGAGLWDVMVCCASNPSNASG
jgi:glucan 1,3-beta-glucosidase